MDGDLRKVVEYHVNAEGKVVKVSETIPMCNMLIQVIKELRVFSEWTTVTLWLFPLPDDKGIQN